MIGYWKFGILRFETTGRLGHYALAPDVVQLWSATIVSTPGKLRSEGVALMVRNLADLPRRYRGPDCCIRPFHVMIQRSIAPGSGGVAVFVNRHYSTGTGERENFEDKHYHHVAHLLFFGPDCW